MEVPLTLSCAELGSYDYKLMLTSTPAGPERGLVFNVPLGSKVGGCSLTPGRPWVDPRLTPRLSPGQPQLDPSLNPS